MRLNHIGGFKDASVFVYNNNLIRFEESVFGPILQQMTTGKGFIMANSALLKVVSFFGNTEIPKTVIPPWKSDQFT